ncbi:MAG: YidC/Oxa1 family membrane protein insertase [Clostridia bacterium]|nr:YidC/Oxa1 family membrane protein insertase [Clostridia bacterium]
MEFLYNNFLSEFFVMVLRWLVTMFGNNYAVAIIVLTIAIRLCLLPLDLKQRTNQERMAALGPELQSLQKRYANDPQQMQRKQRELYQKMNVKPALGCLPMLIQLPILFAFFGAMNILASEQIMGIMLQAAQFGPDTVELPRFFWIHNFWQPDSGLSPILPSTTEFLAFLQRNSTYITPQAMALLRSQDLLIYADGAVSVNAPVYEELARAIIEHNGVSYIANQAGQMIAEYNNGWFILPVLSGLALFLQQKFAPQNANNMAAEAADPAAAEAQGCTNKTMMWFFPLFSVYICCSSNSAFALYWFFSSIYAFCQMRVVSAILKRKGEKLPAKA